MIKEFFTKIDQMPKNKRQKFIKQFVGQDRRLVEDLAELSRIATEEELHKRWNRNGRV